MGTGKKRKEDSQSISAIQNDYVRTIERQEKNRKAIKVRLLRRLVVLGLFAVLVTGFLVNTIYQQKKQLATKEQQKQEVMQKLADTKEQQEALNLQIARLNDDEYIAKLARKDCFLSEEGEIIFSIPENKEKDNKNKDSKE